MPPPKRKKQRSKKHSKRFRLLLDEMFPRRTKFPSTNHFHNLKHIIHDLKERPGISDDAVLRIAKDQKRILITKNIKDFRSKCRKYQVDVVGVKETVSFEETDKLLTAKLNKWGNPAMSGRITKIVQKGKSKK